MAMQAQRRTDQEDGDAEGDERANAQGQPLAGEKVDAGAGELSQGDYGRTDAMGTKRKPRTAAARAAWKLDMPLFAAAAVARKMR